MEQPCTRRSAISSRSANERYRPDSGFADGRNIAGGMPPPFGTILILQAATSQLAAQHLHSPCLPRSPPRTGAAHLVLPPPGDLVRTIAPDRTGPNAACASSSQLLPSRCCDDHLSPANMSPFTIRSAL